MRASIQTRLSVQLLKLHFSLIQMEVVYIIQDHVMTEQINTVNQLHILKLIIRINLLILTILGSSSHGKTLMYCQMFLTIQNTRKLEQLKDFQSLKVLTPTRVNLWASSMVPSNQINHKTFNYQRKRL